VPRAPVRGRSGEFAVSLANRQLFVREEDSPTRLSIGEYFVNRDREPPRREFRTARTMMRRSTLPAAIRYNRPGAASIERRVARPEQLAAAA
jgi:hypothetical protein